MLHFFFCSFTHIVVTMQYQLLFIIAIVTVQVILQVVWLQLTPGHAEMNYDHSEVTLLQCRYVSYVGPVVAIGELGIQYMVITVDKVGLIYFCAFVSSFFFKYYF